jgi:hypothetical protein
MKNELTAAEWLIQELKKRYTSVNFDKLFEQAKQMEKEQIKDAYVEGCGDFFLHEATDKNRAEEYYNETYGK